MNDRPFVAGETVSDLRREQQRISAVAPPTRWVEVVLADLFVTHRRR